MRILITGTAGMVGSALREFCTACGDEVFAYDHQTLNIAEPDDVRRAVDVTEPDAVINCAAWTDVDGCESDPEHAFAANARGPQNLAAATRDVDAAFVTISTDYVFDGTKGGFYTQEDEPNPQSVYGRSKLEGEFRSREKNSATIIVRSGFIFGPGGKNFLSTVIHRARRGEPLKAITDSYGTPTYAYDLARRLRELAQLKQPEIFHVANAGDGTSYAGFAREAILSAGLAEPRITGISADSLNRPAPRPRNARLRCLYSQDLGLSPLPDWRDSLREFVRISSTGSIPRPEDYSKQASYPSAAGNKVTK
ncbi:MAG TPA: dTDP-4-dehydrorhamnose reductase [Pyrinomonadaceae bacterium]